MRAVAAAGRLIRRVQLHALLIGAGEHNCVVQRRRPAEGDVRLEGVAEAGRVNLDELVVGEVRIAAGQGEELFGVLFDGPDAAEKDQLAQRTLG
jgi:hypothetical protein